MLIGFTSTVSGQHTKPKAAPSAQPSFSIVISTPRDVVKIDSPISVEVTKTNMTNHEINSSRIRRFCGPYDVDVIDEQGNPRPETGASRLAEKSNNINGIATASIVFSSLKPGEVEHDRIDVERYTDLSRPGKYTIRLHQFDPESQTVVKSNTMNVTVTR